MARATAMVGAYKRLFSTDDGRLVLQDLVLKYILKSPLDPESETNTHINLGMQKIVLEMLKKTFRTDKAIAAHIEAILKDQNGDA